MIKGLLIGFFCFILFLTLHIVIFHFSGQIKKRFRVIKNIFLMIMPIYVLLYALIPRDFVVLAPADPLLTPKIVLTILKVINFFVGFMLYVFLFMCYSEFYFIIDRSLSVRIMIELENSPKKQLSFEELEKVYPPDEVYARRFGHLIESKCIIEDSGYYKNTKKGYYLAILFKLSKNILKVWPGG